MPPSPCPIRFSVTYSTYPESDLRKEVLARIRSICHSIDKWSIKVATEGSVDVPGANHRRQDDLLRKQGGTYPLTRLLLETRTWTDRTRARTGRAWARHVNSTVIQLLGVLAQVFG